MFLLSSLAMQSAHAWMSSSKWVHRVGVFINLESIGPGGVPIVFQHAGSWLLQEYAAAVKNPRGSIAAQVRCRGIMTLDDMP